MIALSWLLWLFVIAIQAIIHFCFIGRRSSKPTTNNNNNNNNNNNTSADTSSKGTQNRLVPSKPQQRQEETIKRDPSSHVEFQDHCKIMDKKKKTTERKGESIPSILKQNHGLRRRRIRSDVSLSVLDQNNKTPLIHSISTSTDGYDDYDDVPSDQHHDNASQDCESDLEDEEEWRLALIQRYVENNPSQESFVSINMLNRSMDSTEEEEGNMISSATTTTSSTRSTTRSVPLVCT
jgi:hypothetical protein